MKLKMQIASGPKNRANKNQTCVTLNYKNGVMYFTSGIASLGFIASDKIGVFFDEEDPKRWFMGRTSTDGCFELRSIPGGKALKAMAMAATRAILKSREDGPSAKYPISTIPTIINGETYYEIVASRLPLIRR